MRFIIFFFLLLHIVALASIEEIIHNHPEIKAIDRKLKSLKQREIYELSLPDPIFSISVKDVQLFYRPFDRNLEPMQSVELKFLQPYILYSKREKRSQIVKSRYRSEYYTLLEKKQELIFQLYQVAYRMWEVKEKLKIIKEYKKVAHDLISLTTTLYSVGKTSQSEVFDAQFFLTQLQRKEIVLRNRLKRLKSRIRYFSDKEIEISLKA
ncbi:MAG: TolC family protein [Persephonella sp.]|nr:TolC family protein [Persephonella sp.]